MKQIFHITLRAEAAEAARRGVYVPERFDAEGFIHCWYAHQLARVADFNFRGRSDLVLLEIDPSALPVTSSTRTSRVELSSSLTFCGRLPMSTVVGTHAFPCPIDGRFELRASTR